MKKIFCLYWHQVGWHCVSLGIHLDIKNWRIEIHVLSGFLVIGFATEPSVLPLNIAQVKHKLHGLTQYRRYYQ